MKKYSILHAPVLSFGSKNFYRDVCFEWKGVNFLFLFLLLLICWIPVMVKMQIGLSDFVANEAPKVIEQIPAITITEGKASIDEPQPYAITIPDTNENLAVIDTTGTITSLQDANSLLLITETDVLFKKNENETQMHSLKEIDELTVDQEKINTFLQTIKKIAVPIMYGFNLLFSYLFRIIQVLIYAAIGLAFASACKCNRTYAELLRLAVVAITPCIIIKTFLSITGMILPLSGLLFFLLALAYLYYGIHATAQTQEPDDGILQSHLPMQDHNSNKYQPPEWTNGDER